ncbi:uncharacterized protein EV420DRAFT_1480638 [Desarmillaria tabescens]|uniref:Ribonuclease H1 N-terminal domain-containing protein n=1 Tax=Armillaria tabescens TaxID=1929756 RepID=A0AA39KAT3_ARMTA|nr:uncharacterized protein EV420DRAFT_1480638 [Desarmillaria tabescens]KAK0457572.1 hypothetical protein EV420DRAFT_1480638 [Desarmillaria tabescens]
MTQQQLNLSPKALVALLQALNALNLTTGSDTAAMSTTPSSNRASTSTTVPASDDGTASAPSSEVAASAPATSPAPAPPTPAPSGCSVTAATVNARPVGSGAPFILHSPFTRLPLPATMQPATATAVAVVAESSVAESSVRPPPAQVHSGFHCSNCRAFNPAVSQTGKAYYVVTAGHEVGIFTSWEKVQPLVSGVAHACHKKYRSQADAEEAFANALTEGKVRVL